MEATKWLCDRRRSRSCSAASFISIFASVAGFSLQKAVPFLSTPGGLGTAKMGAPVRRGCLRSARAAPFLPPRPGPPPPPDPRRARKPTSGAVVPLNRVRTGGGRGASVPRPPGAGVPGWFGPGRRLGPPVALPQYGGWASGRLSSGRRVRGKCPLVYYSQGKSATRKSPRGRAAIRAAPPCCPCLVPCAFAPVTTPPLRGRA